MPRLKTFPVSLKVEAKKIVIVGGGLEALAKARLAAMTAAELHVFCAEGHGEQNPELRGLAHFLHARDLTAADLDGAAMVFVAETGAAADKAKALARAHGVPLNVVDVPEECDFFTPAIVERAPLTVAISTEGAAPVLARQVRAKIEALLPRQLGPLAALAGGLREKVMAALPGGDERRRFFEALTGSEPIARALEGGDGAAARAQAERLLAARDELTEGIVWLIGAGPGAEDLLTLRAQRLLQEADVIVHDELVPEAVIAMGRRDAERISVGKAKGRHSVTQARINSMLIVLAKQGKRVARLKGGDPMVLGRAGEEIAALRRAGIGYSVVPGVTAALAAAADTATPVTLRGVSPGIVFATAHGANDAELEHWAALAEAGMTLGIYMGKSVAGRVSAKLIGNGMGADMPVGIVVNAGRDGAARRLYRGTLGELGGNHQAFASGPALMLIGEAVRAGDWEAAVALTPAEQELVA